MTTPGEHWAAMQRQYGVSPTVRWCADLLTGAIAAADADHPAFDVLGRGGYLERILAGAAPDYWIRVWAARGLLYGWDESATPAVLAGLSDDHWRVREMCAKVCRLRELGQAADELARLVGDDVARVRLAAIRAVAYLGEAEHARVIRDALEDPDDRVAHAAPAALELMSARLDRSLRADGGQW